MMEQSTALTVVQRAVRALRSTERETQLAKLVEASKSISAITNPDGYQQCHAARMSLKNERVDIQKTGKEARDDAVQFSKGVIAEENRLIAIIKPEEDRLTTIQDAWDARIEAEKQARIDAEIKRVKDIQDRIAAIRSCPSTCAASSSTVLANNIGALECMAIDESFAEFRQEASDAKIVTLANLNSLHAAALEREAEQERVRKERAELAELKAQQAKRDEEARLERIEQDRKEKADRDAETARQQAEIKAQWAENARIAAENAARQKVEDDRIKAEREKLAAEQAAVERERQAIRDREAKVEADRLAAEQKRIDDEEAKREEQRKAAERKAAAARAKKRPTDLEIIKAVATAFNVTESKAIDWMKAIDWEIAA